MDQRSNQHRQASARIVEDWEYDLAFKVIAAVQRAATDPAFHAGVIYGYEQAGHNHQAALFTAAVEEQRRFAAEQAEFGNETE